MTGSTPASPAAAVPEATTPPQSAFAERTYRTRELPYPIDRYRTPPNKASLPATVPTHYRIPSRYRTPPTTVPFSWIGQASTEAADALFGVVERAVEREPGIGVR